MSVFSRKEFLRSYNYDSTDGTDNLKKVFNTTKIFGFWGGFLSLYDIIGVSHCSTLATAFARTAYIASPFIVTGFTYSVVTGIVAKVRDKDGPLNHAIGGATAGCALAAYSGRTRLGLTIGVLYALTGAMLKAMRSNGYELIPDVKYKEYSNNFRQYERTYLTTIPDVQPPKYH